MRKTVASGVCIVALLGISPADAAPTYLSLQASADFLHSLTYNGPPDINTVTAPFSTGVGAAAAFGLVLPGFRFEGELGVRNSPLSKFSFMASGWLEGIQGGSLTIFSAMLNGWVDLPAIGQITPYVGGGAGPALLTLSLDEMDDGNPPVGDIIGKSAAVLAYQVGAGLAYRLPNGALATVDYRYFGTTSAGFGANAAPTYGVNQSIGGHTVMFGLRVPLGP